MAQAKEEHVAKLLRQGLEFYGTGEIPRAFMLWNEALELDPGNEEARDYIRDADRRSWPRAAAFRKYAGADAALEAAKSLMKSQVSRLNLPPASMASTSTTVSAASTTTVSRTKSTTSTTVPATWRPWSRSSSPTSSSRGASSPASPRSTSIPAASAHRHHDCTSTSTWLADAIDALFKPLISMQYVVSRFEPLVSM